MGGIRVRPGREITGSRPPASSHVPVFGAKGVLEDREHPTVAYSLNNLAVLHNAQGKYDQAELLYKRSLAIKEKAFGLEHADVAQVLEDYGGFLKATQRVDQGQAMLDRAAAIRKKNEEP